MNVNGIDSSSSNRNSTSSNNVKNDPIDLIALIDNDFDIEFAGEESTLDISIAKAVRQMLDDGPKEPEPSPSEKFFSLYRV